jgi:hypothetical protein
MQAFQNYSPDFLPITTRERAIPAITTSGSPADGGVVGVTHTYPHPPGHPLPSGGQVRVPPVGQGGGVQITVGVTQTTPHPPGHPFPSGGQAYVPEEQDGGVQTIVNDGDGVGTPAAAGIIPTTRTTSRRTAVNRLSIGIISCD